MGVDHGGGDGGKIPPPQNLEWGDCPPRFCHDETFKAPDYLHYNVGKCVFLPLQQDFYSKSHHATPRIPVRSMPMVLPSQQNVNSYQTNLELST